MYCIGDATAWEEEEEEGGGVWCVLRVGERGLVIAVGGSGGQADKETGAEADKETGAEKTETGAEAEAESIQRTRRKQGTRQKRMQIPDLDGLCSMQEISNGGESCVRWVEE